MLYMALDVLVNTFSVIGSDLFKSKNREIKFFKHISPFYVTHDSKAAAF